MVIQINDPWTLKAKDEAIQKEIRAYYEAYIADSLKRRSWSPRHLPQRAIMRKFAHLAHILPPEVKTLLFGFLGVEVFVEDYVWEGIHGAGDSITIQSLVFEWGRQEDKHGKTFKNIIIDAGFALREEVEKFIAEALEFLWKFKDQTGWVATFILAAAYGIVQERQTRFNYTKFRLYLLDLIKLFPQCRELLTAMSEAVAYVEADEVGHENTFRAILRIVMHYRPDLGFDALMKSLSHYQMPKVEFPGKEEFESTVQLVGIINRDEFMNDVLGVAMEKIGLEDRRAVKVANRNVVALPENAIIVNPGKEFKVIQEGLIPYRMTPKGEFVRIAA